MITLTSKITKDVRTFQAGESTGFSMLLGKQYFDYQTKQKVWTNYKVTVFAKDKQAEFYQNALVQGAIVSVYAEDCKVDLYKPEYPNIELINARIDGVFTSERQAPRQPVAQQQNYQQPQRQPVAQQQQQPSDDSIPF